MDRAKNVFSKMNCPVWIKDEYDNIVFINDELKQEFNIENNLEIENITNKNIIKLKDIIKKSSNKDFTCIEINGYIYNQTTIEYESDKKYIIGTLINQYKSISENDDLDKNILKTVIDNIPELIFYKDEKLKYAGINKECEKFYKERGVTEVIGKTDLELPLDEEFISTCREHDSIVMSTKKPLYIEERVPSKYTDDYDVVYTIKTPIINKNGDAIGIVGVVRDITEQKKLEEKLRYLSYIDTLTKLYNRAYFDEKIKELIKDKSYPIGVVIGDVNGLKIVNDTLGHIEGDKLITSMANTLKDVSCDKSMVFRWGGDEFITVIPNTSHEECAKFMEDVNKLCKSQKFDNFELSISQGYSLLTEEDNIDKVIRESEDKVYRQKILDSKSVRTSILSTLSNNLQNKNVETKEHTDRVVKYCKIVGNKLNLDDETMDRLLLVGRLHDIGKIGIPEHILLKNDKLTDEEYEIMKTHSEKGYRLALLLPEFSHISRSILTHHERWDGKGYPLGLKGEEIPITARIVSVVDAYDAMTNDRVYSKAISKKDAIKEIKKCMGYQFDPNISKVFCEIIENEN